MTIQYSAGNYLGLVRKNNEDNFKINQIYRQNLEQTEMHLSGMLDEKMSILAVCDGMGGEAYGEEASLIAVKELQPAMMNHMEEESDRAIREANYKICQLIRQNNGVRSGSTVAVLYLSQERARACNVGDSRIYFCREDKFIHLSKDHNQAQSLVDMGIMPLEDARHSKERHVLTQHLGIFPDEMEICPHYSDELRLQDGDVFLLCSDGLTEDVEDEVIQKALSDKEKTPEHIRDELVEHAMAAGGKDNITIIVARVHIK